MEIQALTPAHGEAFFEFFDQRAFSDNPAWKGCYCTFFHRPEHISQEEAATRPTRRVQAEAMIRGRHDAGLPGLREGRPGDRLVQREPPEARSGGCGARARRTWWPWSAS